MLPSAPLGPLHVRIPEGEHNGHNAHNIEDKLVKMLQGWDTKELYQLVKTVDLSRLKEGGYSLLCAAFLYKKFYVADILLQRGARVEASINSEHDHDTPLHSVLYENNVTLAEIILQRTTIFYRNGLEETVLHYACKFSDPEMVERLLARGLNVNAKDGWNLTPIVRAVERNCDQIVRMLMNYKANVMAHRKRPDGPFAYSVLEIALRNNYLSIFKLLLSYNVPCHYIIDDSDHTLFHLAAYEGRPEMLDALNRRDPTFRTYNYKENTTTPMHLAATKGHKDVLLMLIGMGAPPDIVDEYKRTPLHLAAHFGHDQAVDLLVSAGCDRDAVDYQNQRPSDLAYAKGHLFIVMFLTRSINASIVNLPGLTRSIEDLEIKPKARSLSVIRASRQPLLNAVLNGDCDEILSLVESYSMPLNERDESGHTLMYDTVLAYPTCMTQLERNAAILLASRLIDKGASARFGNPDKGTTILHEAVRENMGKLVSHILGKRAVKVDAVDNDGHTALHVAIQVIRARSIRLHNEHHLYRNLRDMSSKSWDLWSTLRRERDVIAALLGKGASIDAVDKSGKIILEYEKHIPASRYYIIMHIAKFVSHNEPVSERNLDFIKNDPDANEFYEKCMKELSQMKKDKVCANITYYKLLTQAKKIMARPDIEKVIFRDCNKWQKKYPVYHVEFMRIMEIAKFKELFWDLKR